MTHTWRLLPACLFLSSLIFSGCPSGGNGGGSTESSATSGAAGEDAAVPLLEPFDPPPMSELDATANWEQRSVLDSMDLYLEFKAQEIPLTTVENALALKNVSDEENDMILSALGRPPESESDVDYGSVITRCSLFDIKSTNPLEISSTAEFDYHGLAGISLFAFDWRFDLFGNKDVISSWETSADRMLDRVVLRDDLTWSDGRPITAHDVEFSFQSIMNPEVDAVAVRTGTDQLRWVAAYDDRTVVFFHKESLATNALNISFPIIPKHVYEDLIRDDPKMRSEQAAAVERQPVTGGAYRLKSRTPQQEFILERRESWYMHDGQQVRRKPYFQEVRFQVIEAANTRVLALKKGDVDELELTPEHWATQTSDDEFARYNVRVRQTEWGHAYIAWNCQNPFFEDKRVRQAMSSALDHDEMLNEILYGLYEPGTGIYHPTAWMAPKPALQSYKQDLDHAEALLDEAGWEDSDGDGVRDKEIDGRRERFEFSLMVGEGSQAGLRIATLLKENLAQIGVICNIQSTEFTVMQEKAQNHEFQAMMAGWGSGIDPESGENLWTTKFIKGGRNYPAYSNPEVDRLFEAGKREFDRQKRAEIYGQIATILWEDQPYTWLYFRPSLFAFNKRLRGYMFSPRGPYHYGPGFDAIWTPAL